MSDTSPRQGDCGGLFDEPRRLDPGWPASVNEDRAPEDCPECGSNLTCVIDSGRPIRGHRRRTWSCTKCRARWELHDRV